MMFDTQGLPTGQQDYARFFTIGEVARNLGVSTRTVQRWIDSGELVAHRFGRMVGIAEGDLIRFLEKHQS